MPTLDVLLTPAEFEVLPERDLTDTVCVVFDVLRATSSMITALANGASEIIPVSDIPEALSLRAQSPLRSGAGLCRRSGESLAWYFAYRLPSSSLR